MYADKTPFSHLCISGSRGSITFSVVHDSTIGAHHTLHRSHLVAWPTRGSALGSKRGKKRRGGEMLTTVRKRQRGKQKTVGLSKEAMESPMKITLHSHIKKGGFLPKRNKKSSYTLVCLFFPLLPSQRVQSRARFWLIAFGETGSNLCGGGFSYHLATLH